MENQAGLAVLEKTDESISKRKAKAVILDVKIKVEPKDGLELKAGLTMLDKINKFILDEKRKTEHLGINHEIEIKMEYK